MLVRTSTNSTISKETYECLRLAPAAGVPYGVDDRQTRVPGWVQAAVERIRLIIIGAGIGGHVAHIAVKKGVPHVFVFDHDSVEPTNLNRQLFTFEDLYLNKALRLARNLQRAGFLGSRITGYPYAIQDFPGSIADLKPNVLVCAVDNDMGRIFAARLCRTLGIPGIFTAVSTDADQGYVFVQMPDGPCFACLYPEALGNDVSPCPGQPAVMDIQILMSGFVSYAVDSLFMDRKRNWNYRLVRLASYAPDVTETIPRRPGCPLCGGKEEPHAA